MPVFCFEKTGIFVVVDLLIMSTSSTISAPVSPTSTTSVLPLEWREHILDAGAGLSGLNLASLCDEIARQLPAGADENTRFAAAIGAARARIESAPAYSRLAARLLLLQLAREVSGQSEISLHQIGALYTSELKRSLERGVAAQVLDAALLEFDLPRLAAALRPRRDFDWTFLGLQTLFDRYFVRDENDNRLELPQIFWMRVAMGLALQEEQPTERAIEFYEVLSRKRFVSATPTLFHAGTLHPQLSSCYLTTIPDDLSGIFKSLQDNALLSKWAGGLGNDWTNVRALGAKIRGTGGTSQGIVPFLKVFNDAAVAVNQGGRRKGAVCAYLESWHLDIEEFLELRKNTGDDRRRTHDMNTANWIPDLFMQRVASNGQWTLFSPDETPDLHHLYGQQFKAKYEEYEAKADAGELRGWKRVEAKTLWRKMLSMVFETGHPWLTFKDPCNLRSPQSHVGVVHNSNLCCVTGDQRVVTQHGISTVEELCKQGDALKVIGRAGVENATPMFLTIRDSPVVRVETAEGYAHKVTPDHPLWVVDIGWVEAQHLVPGDHIEIQNQEGLWGQIHRPHEALLCGMIAGDGTFGNDGKMAHIDVWSKDEPLLPEIAATVERVLGRAIENGLKLHTTGSPQPFFHYSPKAEKWRLSSQPLARVLAELGFTRETKRELPTWLWNSDRETVVAYLRGLYVCDATAQSSGGITTLALASISRELLADIQILWANFGVKTSINILRGPGSHLLPDGRGGQKLYPVQACYRLIITSIRGCQIAEAVTQFGSHRGLENYLSNLEKQGYQQKFYATFTGLTPCEDEDVYCLTVDTPEHAWVCNGLVTKNTEITLNNSADETAVCNLGSLNLTAFVEDGALDRELLGATIQTAMRMLDNVVDLNYYPTAEAKTANSRHRPVGLGIMGFQDALYRIGISYASAEAVEWADETGELISYHAILASAHLARERGSYETYQGSKWSQGLLPLDTLQLLQDERGEAIEVDRISRLDWAPVRAAIAEFGMRNSNCMAIAPTATISNIAGCSQSIEPAYKNLFVKSNLSGEFTQINEFLVRDLQAAGLWDDEMRAEIKYNDGSVQSINRMPDELKARYKTAFEIEPHWILQAAARRQKWIDMGQSLNLYMSAPSGKKLDEMYFSAWKMGLKTTYYLRTLAATQVEKSTLDVNKFGVQPKWMKSASASAQIQVEREVEGAACNLGEACEACQ